MPPATLTSQAPQSSLQIPGGWLPLHLTSWSCQRGYVTFSKFILEWEPNDSLGFGHTDWAPLLLKTQSQEGIRQWAPPSSLSQPCFREGRSFRFLPPPPDPPQTLVWNRRNHHLQGRHMLMFLSRMKNECYFYFFPSGESVDPFLLGTACKSWRNHFSHLKSGSETDLGKSFHAFEITRYTVEPAPRRSCRKVDLVMRGDERHPEACKGIIRGGKHRASLGTKYPFTPQMFIDHRLPWHQPNARYRGARD